MSINERIRYLRKTELKMTQQDFSSKLNISRSNMGNIETGEVTVTDRVISSICKEFNVNEEWLRNGIGEIFVDLSKEEYIAEFVGRILKDKEDSFKKRYIAMLSKLDEDGWEALEEVATSLKRIKMD